MGEVVDVFDVSVSIVRHASHLYKHQAAGS